VEAGKDMELSTLRDVVDFLDNNDLLNFEVLISGGEPTEHPYFEQFAEYVFERLKESNYRKAAALTITTNGLWLLENYETAVKMIDRWGDKYHQIFFQVTNDKRYYPIKLEPHKRAFRHKNIIFCDAVEKIYPIGRAVTNNLEWEAGASKCFNIRALVHQRPEITLKEIRYFMLNSFSLPHVCSPHIDVQGNIKLGESDLCPVCASIYDEPNEIIQKIKSFQCHKCDFINDKLPDMYKALL
jgi:hypothetical protein